MNPADPTPTPDVITGLLLALLAVLFLAVRVASKAMDEWWTSKRSKGPSSDLVNGNGDMKRVCFMGEGASDRLMQVIESTHDQLRDQIHANQGSVIIILDRLAAAAEKHAETERMIATTLATTLPLFSDRLDRIERRLDQHHGPHGTGGG